MTIGTLQEPKATTFLGLLGQLTGLRFGNLTLAAIFPDLRRAFRTALLRLSSKCLYLCTLLR